MEQAFFDQAFVDIFDAYRAAHSGKPHQLENPFAEIEKLNKQLRAPLHVMEWMPTHERAPKGWIMPILTMPFDEGVAGQIGSQKEEKTEGKE